MRRGDIRTIAGGKDYAEKLRPVDQIRLTAGNRRAVMRRRNRRRGCHCGKQQYRLYFGTELP